jgi:hypothetical protein
LKPKKVLATVAAALLGFVALTAWALESGGVAILETRRADGGVRETHVWFVVRDGELWVEAGSPDNGWFVDVQQQPLLAFRSDEESGALSGSYRARIDPDPGAAPRLRGELRDKYGFRDLWVGMLVDSSRSRAVQLHPARP